jgi:hypothetical protein
MTHSHLNDLANDRSKNLIGAFMKKIGEKDNIKRQFLGVIHKGSCFFILEFEFAFLLVNKIKMRIKKYIDKNDSRLGLVHIVWTNNYDIVKMQKLKKLQKGKTFFVKEKIREAILKEYFEACKRTYITAFRTWRQIYLSKDPVFNLLSFFPNFDLGANQSSRISKFLQKRGRREGDSR